MISPIEIMNIASLSSEDLDTMQIMKYLWQESQSMNYISPEVLQAFAHEIDNKYLKPIVEQKRSAYRMIKSVSVEQAAKFNKDLGPSIEEITERGKNLLISLADYLFDNNLTLLNLLQKKIFSKTIDGREYQLIKQDHLYQCLS